jgi:glycosyltransferase involved in cell wall biosynthesis
VGEKKISSRKFLSVVIPAYNEEGAISDVVRAVRRTLRAARIPHEILVVDDGSSDGTASRARQAGARVILMGENHGYGSSLKAGFRAAQGDLLAMLDADGTYPEQDLPRLVREMDGADMVVGARTQNPSAIPALRRPAKWLLTRWAEYLSERRIPDLNSGMRVFRREAYSRFQGLMPNRFSFTTTITLALECHGYVVKYLPIDYRPRTGDSKIRPISDTLNFFSIVLRTVMYFKPLKIFLPLSGAMIFTGITLGIWKLAQEGGVTDATTLFVVAGLQTAAIGLLADLVVKRHR